MNPDPLIVACAYLRTVDAVTAIVGERVFTRKPPTLSEPWVRVHLIDDRTDSTSSALHLTHALLQLDCYAGDPREGAQYEASLLARTVRAALHAMSTASHEGAVVCSVTLGGIQEAPDAAVEPVRERYIVSAELHLHP